MQKMSPSRELTPPITITSEDHQKLTRLASAYATAAPEVSEYLLRELERAKVIKKPDAMIVHIGSWVTFRDETTAREQTVQLVYPDKADIAEKRISVMTPIGAALVGMTVDKTITFYNRENEAKNLTVLAVSEREPLPSE